MGNVVSDTVGPTPFQWPPTAAATTTATLPFSIERGPGALWALPAVNGNIPQVPASNDGSPQADGNGPKKRAGLDRILSSEFGPGTLGRFEVLPNELLRELCRQLPLSTFTATALLSRGMFEQTAEIALRRRELLARANKVDTLAKMQEILGTGDGEFRKICLDLGDAFGGRLLGALANRLGRMWERPPLEMLLAFELVLKAVETLPREQLRAALIDRTGYGPEPRTKKLLEALTDVFDASITTDWHFTGGTGLRLLELVKEVPEAFREEPLAQLAELAQDCKNEELKTYDAVLNEILSLSPELQTVPLECLAGSADVLRKTGVSASQLRIKEIIEVVRNIHANQSDNKFSRRWNTS
jgi:hypothetical protein